MGKTFRLTIVIALAVSAGYAENWENYDLAPGAVPGISQPSDDQWDLLYAWEDMEAQTGDNGLLGICFDGELLWVSGRGVTSNNQIYQFDPQTGDLVNAFNIGIGIWGIRDMCFDGTFVYGGEDGGLRVFDPVTQTMVTTIPAPGGMAFQRANAYDPATDHFYCGNFGTTCYEQDREGNLIRSWSPAPLAAVYGMAWDDDTPDGPWLWVHDQTNPVTGCNIHQMDPVTLQYTGYSVTVTVPPSVYQMAGGLDYCDGLDPAYTSMLVFNQGTPDAGAAFEVYPIWVQPDLIITNFMVEHNGPELTASLSWVVIGSPISELDGVLVYRNGVLIADLTDVQIGEPYNWDDENVPSAGMYDFLAMPYNYQGGTGVPASAGVWIGLDVPGYCQDFEAEWDPYGFLEVSLSWSPPVEGMHSPYAYYEPDSVWWYNIYRAPQGVSLVLIADMVTDTFFVDNPPFYGWYEYGVQAVNSSGGGEIEIFMPYWEPPGFEQIPYEWTEISEIGTNTGLAGDNQSTGPFDLGFDFPYFNMHLFSTINICTNGFASFTSLSNEPENTVLPNTGIPNNLIAPYWDDLLLSNESAVYYYYEDAVFDRFIIQWDSVQHAGGSYDDYYTFELILDETGYIYFMYKDIVPGTFPDFPSATVGIESGNGTAGVQVTYNGSGPLEPASGMGIRVDTQEYGIVPLADIEMVPYGLPITIPASGGSFDFNITVTSLENYQLNLNVWTMAILPDGSEYGPIIDVNHTWAAWEEISRDRTQMVPANAPAGIYQYSAYAGNYPLTICDEDHFEFEKLTTGEGSMVSDWYCWGEEFPGEVFDYTTYTPDEYLLHPPYPNPFNNQTTIEFSIPTADNVLLKVFDVRGREVTTLVNGWMNAGRHEAVFDAQLLPSGVYFVRLELVSGIGLTDRNACPTMKVMLVK